MTAGMAEVIAAHIFIPRARRCFCGGWDGRDFSAGTAPAHATHAAEELAREGYGNAQEVLLAAADEMPIETLGGADKASVWLRNRATRLEGGA